MNIIDKILINIYTENTSRYNLAKHISIILIFLFILFFSLLFLDYETKFLYIFFPIVLSVIVISLGLIKFGFLEIAVPFFLFLINIFSSVVVFSFTFFNIYIVYMISTFQLIILFISTLITNNKIYAFLMSSIGIITLILHLIFRTLVLTKDTGYSSYEDYIVAASLIALSAYLLSRIIEQKQIMTEKIQEDLNKSVESNKKLSEAYEKLNSMKGTLVQSEKMRSIGSLAAGMAHEINNPLAGVVQGAQAVANRLNSDTAANKTAAEAAGLDLESLRAFLLDRKIFSQLDFIRNSGNRASEIVNSIMSFARKDGQKSSQNITLLIEKALLLAEKDYSSVSGCTFKEIEVIKKYEDNLPQVPCDSEKIQQVLLNIFKNGAEAMFGLVAGSATTELPQFTIIITALEGSIKIVIENNGSHIDSKTQKYIFDPFFTNKPEGYGRGLGLAVAYFIVTQTHSGSLTVTSKENQGTKFIIELPV